MRKEQFSLLARLSEKWVKKFKMKKVFIIGVGKMISQYSVQLSQMEHVVMLSTSTPIITLGLS